MKKVSLAAFLASALLLSTPLAQADSRVKGQKVAVQKVATPVAPSTGGYHSATAELIARPSNKRSIFELDLMAPVYQGLGQLLFIDLRGQLDTKRNKEANLGLGYRQIVQNSFILGGYVYGDWRRTRNSNNFWQVTLGAEALSIASIIDLRMNGYLPERKKKPIRSISNTATIVTNGNVSNIQLSRNVEGALPGFDGEVGLRIPMLGMNEVETRLFAGGYRFSRPGTQKVAGPRGRIEIRINDVVNTGSRLTFGVEVSNDKRESNKSQTHVFGHIGLRIPLQFMDSDKGPQGLRRRLMDYVVRDVDAVTSVMKADEGLLKNAAGQDIRVWVANAATGTAGAAGTLDAPVDTLDAAILKGTQEGDEIFAQPNAAGTALTTAAAGVVAADKTIIFGGGLRVVSQDGSIYTMTNLGDTKTKVTGFATGPTIDAGNNSITVKNLDITGQDHADAHILVTNYTGTGKMVTVDTVSITATGNTATSQGIVVTAGAGSEVTATYTKVAVTGFSNAGSAGISNLATGAGVSKLMVNSRGLNLTGNATGMLNKLDATLAGSSLSVMDNESTFKDNTVAARTTLSGLGQETLSATHTNPIISSDIDNATGILVVDARRGVVPIVKTSATVKGGSITMTGGAPIGLKLDIEGQTTVNSSATFTVEGVTFTGNNVTTSANGSTNIGIVRGGEGTLLVNIIGNTFNSSAGKPNNGADINFDNPGGRLASTGVISGNTFNSNSTGPMLDTAGSIALSMAFITHATQEFKLINNKWTGTGNNGNGILILGANGAINANSVVLDATGGGNIIKGYARGIHITDGGTAPGAFVLDFTGPGNQITGNTTGINRSAGVLLNARSVIFNGYVGEDAATLYGHLDVQAVVFGNTDNSQANNIVR